MSDRPDPPHDPRDEELHAFVDGTLDPARRAAVEARIAQDPDAAERARAWRRQIEGVHALFDPIAEEAVPLRLWRIRPRRSRPVAAAAVLVLCVAIGGAGGWFLRGLDGTALPPPADLALSHRAAVAHAVYAPEVRHPVEVGANEEAHLVAWLSKRLGTPIKAPKLEQVGFRLVGGRLLASGQGPAAHFMYEDERGRRITLYVEADMPAGRETAFRFAVERGVGVFYWVDGPAAFAIAGELERKELLRVAKLTHAQVNP